MSKLPFLVFSISFLFNFFFLFSSLSFLLFYFFFLSPPPAFLSFFSTPHATGVLFAPMAPKERLALRPLRRMVPERKALAARRPASASSSVDLLEPDGLRVAVGERDGDD